MSGLSCSLGNLGTTALHSFRPLTSQSKSLDVAGGRCLGAHVAVTHEITLSALYWYLSKFLCTAAKNGSRVPEKYLGRRSVQVGLAVLRDDDKQSYSRPRVLANIQSQI